MCPFGTTVPKPSTVLMIMCMKKRYFLTKLDILASSSDISFTSLCYEIILLIKQ